MANDSLARLMRAEGDEWVGQVEVGCGQASRAIMNSRGAIRYLGYFVYVRE